MRYRFTCFVCNGKTPDDIDENREIWKEVWRFLLRLFCKCFHSESMSKILLHKDGDVVNFFLQVNKFASFTCILLIYVHKVHIIFNMKVSCGWKCYRFSIT